MLKIVLSLVLSVFVYADDVEELRGKCAQNDAESCNNLAMLHEKGKGVKQDYFDARDYYVKACELDHAEACFNLAVLFGRGKGVRQNKLEAREYFGKACDLGLQSGCDMYKMLN